MNEPKQTIEEWWKEDAARLDEMAKLVKQFIGGSAGEPPPLNPDGSLAEDEDEDEDEDEAAS